MTAPAPRAAADPPVVHLRTPAELAAAVPYLCGFVPAESLVVVTLRGERSRVGLTMRHDLPSPAHDDALVDDVVRRVVASGAHAALAVVCTVARDRGELPRARLVRRLRRALADGGVTADEALLVREGRWWSYACRDRSCCPPAGTPVPSAADSAGLALVEAHAALDGRAVLPSRAALEAGLAAPPRTPELERRLSAARRAHAQQQRQGGRTAAREQALADWRRATAAGPAERPDDATAAALVVALEEPDVRDRLLASLVDDDEALFGLLLDLARRTPSPADARVCALLGWAAHLRGDGALAHVALDRALASRPGLSLAQLSRTALDRQLEPAELRELLVVVRDGLRVGRRPA